MPLIGLVVCLVSPPLSLSLPAGQHLQSPWFCIIFLAAYSMQYHAEKNLCIRCIYL